MYPAPPVPERDTQEGGFLFGAVRRREKDAPVGMTVARVEVRFVIACSIHAGNIVFEIPLGAPAAQGAGHWSKPQQGRRDGQHWQRPHCGPGVRPGPRGPASRTPTRRGKAAHCAGRQSSAGTVAQPSIGAAAPYSSALPPGLRRRRRSVAPNPPPVPTRLGASRLGDSALILEITELLDTTAAGPVHVLSALKVATNETYCLGSQAYTLQVIYMYPSKA